MDPLTHLFLLSMGIFMVLASANGTTCMDGASCVPDTNRLTDAITNRRLQEACEIVTMSDSCLQSAIDDCKAQEVEESVLKPMLDMQQSYQPQMQTLCQAATSGGTVPVNATCMDLVHCTFDSAQVQTALADNRVAEACAMVTPSAKCLQSAYNDCKEKQILPQNQLDTISEQVKQVTSLVEERCGDNSGVITFGIGTADEDAVNNFIPSCSEWRDCLVGAIIEGNSLQACKKMITMQKCVQTAIDDCKTREIVDGDMPAMEQTVNTIEPRIQEACQPIATGGVHCLLMSTCSTGEAERLDEYVANKQYQKACNVLTPFVKCQSAALDDCKSRGLIDEQGTKEIEYSINYADTEMNKLNCTSGNSAVITKPIFHVFLIPISIFLVNSIRAVM